MRTAKYLAFTALFAGAIALQFTGITGASAEGYKGSAKAGASVSTSAFKSLDSDKNGVLSETEYNAHPSGSANFSQLDTNSDGSLTLSELRTSTKTPTGSNDASGGTSANATGTPGSDSGSQ